MPTMPVDNIEKLAQSNEKVAHAMTIMAETLRDSQAEMGKAINKMAVDVATIRNNSEHERSHRERLEEKLNTHADKTQAEIASLKLTIADDGKVAAADQVRSNLTWGALCGGVAAAAGIAWHTITGKGG